MTPTPDSTPLGRAGQLQAKHTQGQTNITHNTANHGIQEERKLSARRMIPWREALSDKETDRAAVAQSEEAPRQPRKTTLQQNALLQEVAVKTETMDVREARLQDLRASGCGEQVPRSIKTDLKRRELLPQPGMMPQKTDARPIRTLCL